MDELTLGGVLVAIMWHILHEARRILKPEVRASDVEKLEKAVKDMSDTCVATRLSFSRQLSAIHAGVQKIDGKDKGGP